MLAASPVKYRSTSSLMNILLGGSQLGFIANQRVVGILRQYIFKPYYIIIICHRRNTYIIKNTYCVIFWNTSQARKHYWWQLGNTALNFHCTQYELSLYDKKIKSIVYRMNWFSIKHNLGTHCPGARMKDFVSRCHALVSTESPILSF